MAKDTLPKLKLAEKIKLPDITQFKFSCGNEAVFSKVPEYQDMEKARTRGKARAPTLPLADYIPKLTDPVRIICVNFHIFRDANGQGHYQVSDIPRLRQIMDWANQPFGTYLDSPSDPVIPFYPLITDTRIRFQIQNIEFYDDNNLHNGAGSISLAALQAAAVARNPQTLKQLNVYFTNGSLGYAAFTTYPSTNLAFDSWVVVLGGPSTPPSDYARATTLSHEFGHVLDLAHTYAPGANCNTSDPDFLIDVFGNPSTCAHVGNWGADALASPIDRITNNMMGGNNSCRWVSALQAAMMQRALKEKSVQRYVGTGCKDCVNCLAFTVRGGGHVSQGAPAKLAYEVVDLNESWGWNGTDFVAPVSGIYHFDTSFVKDSYYFNGTQDDVTVDIIRNGTFSAPLATAWSGEGAGRRGSGCVSFNVRLQAGDIISTMVKSDGTQNRHVATYTFSGQLICNCC